MKRTLQEPTKQVVISFRASPSFRDYVKHRSIRERRSMGDIITRAVERDVPKQWYTTADELLDSRFRIRLKKQRLRRADYYNA